MEARLELGGWFRRMIVTQENVAKGVIRLSVGPPLCHVAVNDTEGRRPNNAGFITVTFHFVGKTEDGRPWFRAE